MISPADLMQMFDEKTSSSQEMPRSPMMSKLIEGPCTVCADSITVVKEYIIRRATNTLRPHELPNSGCTNLFQITELQPTILRIIQKVHNPVVLMLQHCTNDEKIAVAEMLSGQIMNGIKLAAYEIVAATENSGLQHNDDFEAIALVKTNLAFWEQFVTLLTAVCEPNVPGKTWAPSMEEKCRAETCTACNFDDRAMICMFALIQRVNAFRAEFGPDSEEGHKFYLSRLSSMRASSAIPNIASYDGKAKAEMEKLQSAFKQFAQLGPSAEANKQALGDLEFNLSSSVEGFYREVYMSGVAPKNYYELSDWTLRHVSFEKEIASKLLTTSKARDVAGKGVEAALSSDLLEKNGIAAASGSVQLLEEVIKSQSTDATHRFRMMLRVAFKYSKVKNELEKHVIAFVSQRLPDVVLEKVMADSELKRLPRTAILLAFLSRFLSSCHSLCANSLESNNIIQTAVRNEVKKMIAARAPFTKLIPWPSEPLPPSWLEEAAVGYTFILQHPPKPSTTETHCSDVFFQLSGGLTWLYGSSSLQLSSQCGMPKIFGIHKTGELMQGLKLQLAMCEVCYEDRTKTFTQDKLMSLATALVNRSGTKADMQIAKKSLPSLLENKILVETSIASLAVPSTIGAAPLPPQGEEHSGPCTVS